MPQYLEIVITPDGSHAKIFSDIHDAQYALDGYLDADGMLPDGVTADYVRIDKPDGIMYAICYADTNDGCIHYVDATSMQNYAIAFADGFLMCYDYMIADGLNDNDHIEMIVVEVHPDGQAKIIA